MMNDKLSKVTQLQIFQGLDSMLVLYVKVTLMLESPHQVFSHHTCTKRAGRWEWMLLIWQHISNEGSVICSTMQEIIRFLHFHQSSSRRSFSPQTQVVIFSACQMAKCHELSPSRTIYDTITVARPSFREPQRLKRRQRFRKSRAPKWKTETIGSHKE